MDHQQNNNNNNNNNNNIMSASTNSQPRAMQTSVSNYHNLNLNANVNNNYSFGTSMGKSITSNQQQQMPNNNSFASPSGGAVMQGMTVANNNNLNTSNMNSSINARPVSMMTNHNVYNNNNQSTGTYPTSLAGMTPSAQNNNNNQQQQRLSTQTGLPPISNNNNNNNNQQQILTGGAPTSTTMTPSPQNHQVSSPTTRQSAMGRSATNAAFGVSVTSSPPLAEASSNMTRSPEFIRQEIHALRKVAKRGKPMLPPVLSSAITCLQNHHHLQNQLLLLKQQQQHQDAGNKDGLRENSLSPVLSSGKRTTTETTIRDQLQPQHKSGREEGTTTRAGSPSTEDYSHHNDTSTTTNNNTHNNQNVNHSKIVNSEPDSDAPTLVITNSTVHKPTKSCNNDDDDDDDDEDSKVKNDDSRSPVSPNNAPFHNNNNNNNSKKSSNNNNNAGNRPNSVLQQLEDCANPQNLFTPPLHGFSNPNNNNTTTTIQNKSFPSPSSFAPTPKSVSPQALKALMMRRRSSADVSPQNNINNDRSSNNFNNNINNAATATGGGGPFQQRPRINSRIEPNAPLIHLEMGNDAGSIRAQNGQGGMSTTTTAGRANSSMSGLSIPASLFRRLPGGWIADASIAPLINSFSNEDILSMSASDNAAFFSNNSFGQIALASLASRPDSPLQPAKQYVVLKTLGKGSFSRVYLVRDVTNNSLFVNKIMKWEHAENEPESEAENRHRLAKRDVNLISNCAHPNIVQYIDSYETNKATHLIVEYVEGGDLSREVERRRAIGRLLRIEVALRFWVQIALALDYLHRSDVVHRDVKPANIMICKGSDGFVKLSDFGFAARSFEERGEQFGTPFYAAPEMWFPVDHSTKSDVWSCGVLLYELLSLRLPFPNNNTAAHAATKQRCAFAPLPPSVPDDLRNAVTEMLRFEPTERPSLREILSSNSLLRAALKDLFEAVKMTTTMTDAMREVGLSHIAEVLGMAIPKKSEGVVVAGAVAAVGGTTNNNNQNNNNAENEQNRSSTVPPAGSQQETVLVPRALRFNPNASTNK